jgi:glycosyltransferase involved in cell wall biosynthesis
MTPDDKVGARGGARGAAMRVVHLCTPARVGGLERVIQALAPAQAARGHDVSVVAVVSDAGDAEAFFAPFAGTAVRTRPLVMGARAYLGERRAVRALAATERPDVVHTHGYRADLLHGAHLRRAGVATVSTVHGSSRMGGLSHLFEWMQLRALRGFDAIISVSSPLAATLRSVGVPAARLHVVANAVPARTDALPRDAARARLGVTDAGVRVLGWIGRIVDVKGADVFVRALAGLPAAGAIGIMIGDGPARAAVEALAASLELGARVRFLGEVADAAPLMSGFDAFVLSSRSEGTPIVILEAMRAGLPIIATRVGGVPDVVQDPQVGWLVPPEAPEALAGAMRALLDDPAEAARRGRAGAERWRSTYDVPQWVERHDAVYAAAMRARPGRAARGGP